VFLLVATGAPVPKDVVMAVLGASAGVGGLVLVFLGVLITSFGAYPGDTSEVVLRPYRRGAWASVAVFAVSLVAVALSLAWLAIAQPHWLYLLTLVVFCCLLATVFGLAAAVTKAAL
jgi:hypothetical protein